MIITSNSGQTTLSFWVVYSVQLALEPRLLRPGTWGSYFDAVHGTLELHNQQLQYAKLVLCCVTLELHEWFGDPDSCRGEAYARCSEQVVALVKCVDENKGPSWYWSCGEPYVALQVGAKYACICYRWHLQPSGHSLHAHGTEQNHFRQ